ncbi:hypothetical protein LEMLEM_LOCUS6929 [Lemmus lemmus]
MDTFPGSWMVVRILILKSIPTGFSVALEPVLELALGDQAGLELTEIHLPPESGIKGSHSTGMINIHEITANLFSEEC